MKKSTRWQIVEVLLLLLGAAAGFKAENTIRREAEDEARQELLEENRKEEETAN